MFHGIFKNCTFYSSIIICLHTVIWGQVFQSNTNNLDTVVWFQVFLSNTNKSKQKPHYINKFPHYFVRNQFIRYKKKLLIYSLYVFRKIYMQITENPRV